MLNAEYAALESILTNGIPGLYNLFERQNPNVKCITFGKSIINEKGEEVPLETVLTTEEEQKSNVCLDYIFAWSQERSVFAHTRVEEMFCDPSEINVFSGIARTYTQLSDHYGLSTEI